jgi:NAD+ kinase
VPDSRPIEVTLETEGEEVHVTVDGQEGSPLGYLDTVRVKRSKTQVRLVRTARRTFYDNLRAKLGWGG